MQQAMARQAEAERERRTKIINAEGEFQASERLKDAALVIERHPIALQLRYLQTLLEIGGASPSTIIFPAPVDLIRPFLERNRSSSSNSDPGPRGRRCLRTTGDSATHLTASNVARRDGPRALPSCSRFFSHSQGPRTQYCLPVPCVIVFGGNEDQPLTLRLDADADEIAKQLRGHSIQRIAIRDRVVWVNPQNVLYVQDVNTSDADATALSPVIDT